MATISFYGGVGTVTGSKYLLEHGGKKVLVDCGLFQGLKELREKNWQEPPFDPKELDAVIITHGGVIMALLAAFGLPEAPMHEWLTPSGCGYTVSIIPSVWMNGQKFEVVGKIPVSSNQPDAV